MGVIIKYQLDFTDVGLKVSNDVYSGEFIIDADITAEMIRGATGSKFKIDLYDLPERKAKELYDQIGEDNHRLTIKLGYFDGSFKKVMDGVVKKVRSKVTDSKLVTHLEGDEIGTNALREAQSIRATFERDTTLGTAIGDLLDQEAEEGISKTPVFTPSALSREQLRNDLTLEEQNLLEALDRTIQHVDTEIKLLVCDGEVRIGRPIENDRYEATLDRDTNLAVFEAFRRKIPDEGALNIANPLQAVEIQGFEFTIVGDPDMRPAQKVTAEVKEYNQLSGADFRIHSVVHKFSASAGYTCKGTALRVTTSDEAGTQETAGEQPSAENIVRRLTGRMESEQQRRPATEVGQVQSYEAEEHRCTLYHGQRYRRPTEAQPSIRTPVENEEERRFLNKPILSPFAWHKCGLIVPIYPGMKALLNHNLNLPNDVLVTGFMWSEQPEIEPPSNNEGDWWLCLPIDFDTSQQPTDSTKAANDLIANNGKRVIEVKGLKISVGASALGNIGERPTEGDDDELLIEHSSGASIRINDSGIELTDGQVTLKIGGGTVDIS